MRRAIAGCGGAVVGLAVGAGLLEVKTRVAPHDILYPLALLCMVGGMLLGMAIRMGSPGGRVGR